MRVHLDLKDIESIGVKDNGATWGDRVITDANGTQIGYVPLAQYRFKRWNSGNFY